MLKTILHIDSCIKSKDYNTLRIQQYVESCNSIFKYMDFFKKNNIDVVLIDNSISLIDEMPNEIRCLIPTSVNIILKKNDFNYGYINKTAGVFEHWKLGRELFKNYDYIIHFELRLTLLNIDIIEDFIQNPISMFGWHTRRLNIKTIEINELGFFKKNDTRFKINEYGKDNRNYRDKKFNDFHTGFFICLMNEFIKLVDNTDLNILIKPSLQFGGMISLEKLLMCYVYYCLPEFKMVEKLNIKRYSSYYNMNNIEIY